jgi:predicted metal-binding membrane protein
MDLVAMAMPSTGAWGPMDLLLVFAMWAVMMVAMMVPSATPMLLAFATISCSRSAEGRAFVPLWVFLAGYLALWTAFSLTATLAQWGLHSLRQNGDVAGSAVDQLFNDRFALGRANHRSGNQEPTRIMLAKKQNSKTVSAS